MEPKTRALRRADRGLRVHRDAQREQEALHLEATLVKRHQPFFNVRLKDDKHYPYLQRRRAEPVAARRDHAPRREGRRALLRAVRVGASVRTTLDIVKKLFPWRSLHEGDHGHGPAALPRLLHPPLHRALHGVLHARRSTTRSSARRSSSWRARRTRWCKSLQRQMEDASERAGSSSARRCFRDQITAVESVAEKQIVERIRPTDEDVFGLARDASTERDGARPACRCSSSAAPRWSAATSSRWTASKDETDADVLGSFLKQFYESATYVPKPVVVPFARAGGRAASRSG